MARKRSRVKAPSNNPSTVVVVFLVFFIILSLGLGVWGYFNLKKAGDNLKDKVAAEDKGKKDQKALDFYRLQYLWMKATSGHKLENANGVDEANELKDLMARYENNQYSDQPGAKPFADLVYEDKVNLAAERDPKSNEPVVDPKTKKVEKFPGYDGTTKRFLKGSSYVANWKKYQDTIAGLEKKKRELEAERDTLQAKEKDRQEANDLAMANVNKKVDKVLQGAVKATEDADKEFKAAQEAKNNARTEVENEIKGKLGNTDVEIQKLKGQIAQLQEAHARALKDKDQRIAQLMANRAQTEGGPLTDEKTVQTDLTQYDTPKGKIVRVDWTGKMPYISLGSADGVKEQLTFSVFARSSDGKVAKEPKGSLEVIKVLGPHLSQTRISYLRDLSGDPLMEGDLVFNPAWNPHHKTHVAIAGLVDFSGDGPSTLLDQVRNLREFISNLERQNVVVDAYLDLQTNTIKPGPHGAGRITLKTDYLILAQGPNYDDTQTLNLKEGKGNVKEKTNEMMQEMRKQAQDKGVTIIPLHKFALLTGYRMPRTLPSASETESRPEPSEPKANPDDEEKPKKDEKKGEKKLGEEKKKDANKDDNKDDSKDEKE